MIGALIGVLAVSDGRDDWAVFGAVIGVLAVGAFIVVAYRRRWRWAGLAADAGDGTPTAPARPAKTLWDWLQLLIIPLVLALAAFALNATQAAREATREDHRAAQEREIAADRAREDTLRVYLQQMSDLITQHGLRRAQGGTPTLARTLTLIALRRLDSKRKGLVVQFLLEEGLITSTTEWRRTPQGMRAHRLGDGLLSLSHADLQRVDLRGVALVTGIADDPDTGRELTVAADLHSADLRHADLRRAALDGVSLESADLRDADLSGAQIDGTTFLSSCLSRARFVDAIGGVGSPAAIHVADFRYAEGRDVDFTKATIPRVDFRGAELSDVKLRGANTDGVMWPHGWTSTGIRGRDVRPDGSCTNAGPIGP